MNSTVTNLAVKHDDAKTLSMDDLDKITDFFCFDHEKIEAAASAAWCNMGTRENHDIGGTPVQDYMATLLGHIRETFPAGENFKIQIGYGGRERGYRVNRDSTVPGAFLAIRKIAEVVPVLTDLRLPKWWNELLLQDAWCREGGLVVIAAPTGSGKSTTMGATIRARLEQFGGFARTVEDPAELPLTGRWGNGRCVQKTVDTETHPDAFAKSTRSFMRGFAAASDGGKIILVGEVRDSAAAAAVFEAAISGHLVLTTTHADSPTEAIRRLKTMATPKLESEEAAADLLGSAFRMAMTQRIVPNPLAHMHKQPSRIVEGEVLISSGARHAVGINIRDRKFHMLDAQVERQRNLMATYDPSKTRVEDLIKLTGNGGEGATNGGGK